MSKQEAGSDGRDGALAMGALLRPSGGRFHLRNWPFRLKLGLVSLGLSLVPALLVLALLAWQSGRLGSTSHDTATADHARAGANLVGSLLTTYTNLMHGLASSPAGSSSDDNAALALVLQPATQRIQAYRLAPQFHVAATTIPSWRDGYVTNSGGTVLDATSSALFGANAGTVLAVQEAVASRAPATVLGPSLVGGRIAVVVAAPILNGATAVGAVVGEFDPSGLLDALSAAGGTMILTDGRSITGQTLPTGAPAQLVGTPLTPTAAASDPALAALHGQAVTLDGGRQAVPVAPNVSGVFVVPAAGATSALLSSGPVMPILLVLAVLTVAAVLASAWKLTRPLTTLAKTLVAVRAGNYGMRVRLHQQDEIGQIAATVDMLTQRTQSLVTDLDNQRLELENGIIQLFTELAEAASGDLTVRPTMSEGSLGAVADSVGILLERFNGTVKRIQDTASAVSMGTSQVAATVLRVSQEAQKQATQLTSSATAITEMATSAQSVSQRTQAATDVAAQAVAAVESGNKAVNYAREAVKRTRDTSKKAARQVKTLGESAQLMGNALLLVQRNTEELHLIAGNASIEAARYAENGGVFRTVADSIEQLAQQSQVALRQIQEVVENTQRETSRVVAAIEEVTNEVMNVAKAVGLAGENFDTINVVVQRLADLNVFIASASQQQAYMAANVAEMIGNLNQVSVQTSMNTAASAEAAVRLRQLTEQLNDSVSTLKVS